MGYKYNIDPLFFEKWSPNMAYILGYIFADGCLLKNRYRLKIASCDKSHLRKVLYVMKSNYPMLANWSDNRKVPNYYSIVDSKKVYFDLIRLGLVPRKSKVAELPYIPERYFFHFLRGYFDGDGSVYYDKPHIDRGDKKYVRLNACFTSASYNLLNTLQELISKKLKIYQQKLSKNYDAFKLRYSTQDALKLLSRLYKNSNKVLRLDRKYRIYFCYISSKNKQNKERLF